MPNKSQIANGVLVASLAYDMYVCRKNRAKYNELMKENIILLDHLEHAKFVVAYMVRKLGENEIELTEFDMIALSNPM